MGTEEAAKTNKISRLCARPQHLLRKHFNSNSQGFSTKRDPPQREGERGPSQTGGKTGGENLLMG